MHPDGASLIHTPSCFPPDTTSNRDIMFVDACLAFRMSFSALRMWHLSIFFFEARGAKMSLECSFPWRRTQTSERAANVQQWPTGSCQAMKSCVLLTIVLHHTRRAVLLIPLKWNVVDHQIWTVWSCCRTIAFVIRKWLLIFNKGYRVDDFRAEQENTAN